MSEVVDIEPYFNPAHWSGHTLGLGHVQEHVAAPLNNLSSAERFARDTLRTCVPDRNVGVDRSFYAGDAFDATQFSLGTVVLFREEQMHGTSLREDYDLEKIAAQPLPAHLTATAPSFHPDAPDRFGKDAQGRHYSDLLKWGVVAGQDSESDAPDRIMWVEARLVRMRKSGAAAAAVLFRSRAPHISVGETIQTATYGFSSRGPDAPHYNLRRVSVLHVIAPGLRQTSREPGRSWASGWVGRLLGSES